MLKYYGDSDGNLKFSADLKAITLTIDENGRVLASANTGAFKGAYELGKGLHSLGLKIPGAELKFSNFSENGLDWSIAAPKQFWVFTFKGTYSGSINSGSINFDPRNGLLKGYFDRVNNPAPGT